MAWDCPFNSNGNCIKRNKPCEPLAKGCVLKNKVRFIDDDKNIDNKNIKSKNNLI